MNKIDLIIDALSVAQNSVWSTKIAEALVAARELRELKPEQASNEPPDYVEPPTSDYHNGWEEGFEAAKNLYPQKTKREWLGLTDDEIHKIIDCCTPNNAAQEELNDFARAVRFVEDALRRKNT